MGRDTVQFRCHSCTHCCIDLAALPTPADVIRLVENLKINPYTFLEFLSPDEISGVPKNDPTWLKVNGRRYLMALFRDGKGCFFLDRKTRLCSAYHHRPLLCRLYPFKLNESRTGEFRGFSLHHDVECPKNRDGVVETAPLYSLYRQDLVQQDDYQALVVLFNGRDYPKKAPEDFIDLFLPAPLRRRYRPQPRRLPAVSTVPDPMKTLEKPL